ncbi:hypothetical protein RDABS01_027324 [Bienertia sinuspersici]
MGLQVSLLAHICDVQFLGI